MAGRFKDTFNIHLKPTVAMTDADIPDRRVADNRALDQEERLWKAVHALQRAVGKDIDFGVTSDDKYRIGSRRTVVMAGRVPITTNVPVYAVYDVARTLRDDYIGVQEAQLEITFKNYAMQLFPQKGVIEITPAAVDEAIATFNEAATKAKEARLKLTLAHAPSDEIDAKAGLAARQVISKRLNMR